MVTLTLGLPSVALTALLGALGGSSDMPAPAASVVAHAMLIAGVADAETGAALAGAEVLLPELGLSARADALGEARLPSVPAGRHLVKVRYLGYAPSEIYLRVQGDTVGAVFRLERVAVPVDAVRIRERWVPIRLKDFEIRRNQGIGRFVTSDNLEKVQLQVFPLVAAVSFPGLRAYTDKNSHWHIASTREYLNVSTGISQCDLQVYLDDLALGEGELDTLRTWDLEAVEYYTAPQVPARYRTKQYGCGILLLWSKWR